MVLRKLALSTFRTRRMRVALTIAAIAFSVALVVSVTSGYASVEGAARKFLNQFLGSWDAMITRTVDPAKGVDVALLAKVRADKDVRRAVGRLEAEVFLLDKDGKSVEGRHASAIGIDRAVDDSTDKLKLSSGRWFRPDEYDATVIDEGTQEKTGCKIGDTLVLPGTAGKLSLRVVGTVHKPGILAGYFQSMYVPLLTLQKFIYEGRADRVSKIQLELNEKVDAEAFLARWKDDLAAVDPMLKIALTRQTREELDKNLLGVHIMSYFGGAVSMLAAAFIVFSTVSMGVTERQRTLAMLRAVGLFRSQIAILVLFEGALFAAIGSAVGIPLGLFLVKLLAVRFEFLFTAGVLVSPGGILFSSLGSIAAALIASLLPAYRAMRVDPLEAMSPLAGSGATARFPVIPTFFGILLAAIDPTLLNLNLGDFAFARDIKFYGHFVVGLPTMMIGFFLLAPLFVWLVDRILARPLAALFGLRYELLRQQLSGGLWRAAGTAAALMVGLAVLVVMQTQGNTTLSSWQLPDKFPDVFIYTSSRAGLNMDAQKRIASSPGIQPNGTMPIAMFSPELGGSMFAIAGAAMMPGATMFFGVDPDKAFDIMQLDFRQGNPKDAAAMLKKGKHLVVTEEFHKLKGLNIGDKLTLLSLTRGRMEFTVAGVVWSPGIDVMVSTFDLGKQFEQRTAASVFGSLDDARNLFGVETVYLVAANLDIGVQKETVIKQLQSDLGDLGLNVADVRQLKYDITLTFRRLLMVASTVAWAAMAVAAMGVANTIMASVRSRQWQFGILRSIGVTRSGLARLVLAEALMLGLVGAALGLSAGLILAADANTMWGVLVGYQPPIQVPWGIVSLGTGIIIAVSILASIAPAISVARRQPLELLQAGRAAA